MTGYCTTATWFWETALLGMHLDRIFEAFLSLAESSQWVWKPTLSSNVGPECTFCLIDNLLPLRRVRLECLGDGWQWRLAFGCNWGRLESWRFQRSVPLVVALEYGGLSTKLLDFDTLMQCK